MKAANVWKANSRLVIFLLACLVAATTASGQTGDPPARVARLSNLTGTVSLQPSGATDWSQGTQNSTVTTGDRIYTDQGGRAELQAGPFAVRLSESTDLTMANLNDQIMQLGLAQGTIGVSVFQLPSGNTVEVDTPNGALTMQGAGDYRVDTNPSDGSTLVSVNSGSLQVSGGDVSQTVGSGQSVRLTGTNPIQIANVSQPAPDSFDQWGQDLNRPLASSGSARYVSRDTPGYNDLDNSGRWQEDSQNGPVWYPSGVASNWVPYRNGHWAWVVPWGWTWVEDEPWGFAPFHYGRWAHIGSSWGWLPGPYGVQPYYSPALVAFVGGPGFSGGIGFGGGLGVQAWFPLGPGEPYFPSYNHSDGYLRQVNITNTRNVSNVSNITNINNINNINYANRQVATTAVPTTVFNNGQAVAHRVLPVTAQQVAKAQIIPHPVTSPTKAAMVGGRPAPAPTRIARLAATPPPGQKSSSPASRANQRAPLITKMTPPGKSAASGRPGASLPPPAKNSALTAKSAPADSQRPPPLTTTRTPPGKSGAGSSARASLPPPAKSRAPAGTNASPGAQGTRPPLITKNAAAGTRAASSPTRAALPPRAKNNAPTARSLPARAQRTPPSARNAPSAKGVPARAQRTSPHPAPASRAATSPRRRPATQKVASKKAPEPGAEPQK